MGILPSKMTGKPFGSLVKTRTEPYTRIRPLVRGPKAAMIMATISHIAAT